MLKDNREIEIMAAARQEGLRSPSNYNSEKIKRLIEDFVDIKPGGEYLDIGAGQWDFADIINSKGGVCEGVDRDPCVIELGKHRGYKGYNITYTKEPLNLNKQFDGVFSRGSINPASYSYNFDFLRSFIDEIEDAIKPDGWGLIIPWYGRVTNELEKEEAFKVLDAAFKLKGYKRISLTHEQLLKYGCEHKGTKYVYLKTNK